MKRLSHAETEASFGDNAAKLRPVHPRKQYYNAKHICWKKHIHYYNMSTILIVIIGCGGGAWDDREANHDQQSQREDECKEFEERQPNKKLARESRPRHASKVAHDASTALLGHALQEFPTPGCWKVTQADRAVEMHVFELDGWSGRASACIDSLDHISLCLNVTEL